MPGIISYPSSEHSSVISEWPFIDLASILPDALLILDETGHMVYINPAAEELFGYRDGRANGLLFDCLLPELTLAILSAVADSHAPRRMGDGRVVNGRHRNGHRIPLDMSLSLRQWQDQEWYISILRDVSDQVTYQNALVALDESERRYRGMIDSQNTLVSQADREGRIIFANQAYCKMFGKPLDDLIGTQFSPQVHPADQGVTADAMEKLNTSPNRTAVEQRVLTVSGWRWVSWEYHVFQDSTRNFYEIQAVGADISERKQAEEIVIVERNMAIFLAQKSTAAEALPLMLDLAMQVAEMDCGGIYVVDRISKDLVLLVNKGLSDEFVGRASRFSVGTGQYAIVMKGEPIYQQYLQLPTSRNAVAMKEGLHFSAIIPVKFKNEVIACINVASHFLDEMQEYRRNALENLVFQIGNMISRFQVLDDLVESQIQLQSMFDSLQDYVFVLNSDGRIIQVNQQVVAGLGYSHQELLGMSVLDVHPPELRELAQKVVNDMLAGLTDTCPLSLLRKDGSYIPVETKVVPGRWGNQNAIIGVSRDITLRKAAEEMIRLKVEEFEGFFTISLDLLCIGDLHGNFLRVNRAWENTLGYSADELETRNLVDFVHEDDRASTLDQLVRLRQGKQMMNFVNRIRCKDGSCRYIEWQSQMDGERIYAAARDITKRKADEDLRAQQTAELQYRNRFEEILTSISTRFINLPSEEIHAEMLRVLQLIGEFEQVDRSYIFLIDPDGTLMSNIHEWCAPGIEAQIGRLQQIPVSSLPWLVSQLEQLEEVYIPDSALLPAEAAVERGVLLSQQVSSALVIPLVNHQKLVGFAGFDAVSRLRIWSADSILLTKMVGDVLSNALVRIEMEGQLRQSESRNSALLSAVPDLMYRIRRDGTILDFRANSSELLFAHPDQLVGAQIMSLLEDEVSQKLLACIEAALETKAIQTLEYLLRIGDSSYVFEARFKDSGTDEVTAMIRDISDRARLEQMKSDFINRATHELRTPIATMLLMVNLIDGGAPAEDLKEYWEVLKNEVNREQMLVENMLTVGRLESDRTQLHFRPIELSGLLHGVIGQFELPARDKSIAIALESPFDWDDPEPMVNADETALAQVFINLIGNALKFSRAEGDIRVIVEKKDDGMQVSVCDSGIGIPSEDLPLLFTRFFRGTNAIEHEIPGTGIGLFIVRSIVEKHNGKIKVHSELGKGSQFMVWLPFGQMDENYFE